jgi:beta-1,4-glucosyltransferase
MKADMQSKNSLLIGGFSVTQTTSRGLARHLLLALHSNNKVVLFFANTNFVVQCRSLLHRMQDAPVIVVNDGVGMDIAALLIQKSRFKENLNGTDFTPYLFKRSAKPLRVFLVGGKPEVLQQAADYARHQLGQKIVGVCDGYAEIQKSPKLVAAINRSKPDVVLVALGNPIQEEWILDNRHALDAGIVIGVGALFDFWAGDKSRAPMLMQKLHLEWFYRLCLEPRRLSRRYTIDIVRFLMHCHKHRSIDSSARK